MAPETEGTTPMRAVVVTPSMRPGQDGPGNPASTSRSRSGVVSFNEAGARWPRKLARGYSPRATKCWSFNEAGARWPRKLGRGQVLAEHGLPFNEAGARWPRKPGQSASEAPARWRALQ